MTFALSLFLFGSVVRWGKHVKTSMYYHSWTGYLMSVLLLLEMQCVPECVPSFCLCSSRPLAVAGFLPPTHHIERWGPAYTVWGVTIPWGSCSSPGTRGTWPTINTVFTGSSIFTILPDARAASHTWERERQRIREMTETGTEQHPLISMCDRLGSHPGLLSDTRLC